MNINKTLRISSKQLTILPVLIAIGAGWTMATPARAACSPQNTDLGSASASINVPSDATYTIWSRMSPATAGADSYILEIDDTICGVVAGDGNIATGQWTWVNYRDGNTANAISAPLTAGQHSVSLVGRESGARIDKIILTSDPSCIPIDSGSNCESIVVPIDTTPPSVTIAAPASGTSVSGTVSINATAADNIGVARTELYINDVLQTTSGANLSYSWNTTMTTNGSYTLTVKAYDAANNSTTSTPVVVTVTNQPPDTQAPTVNITTPSVGAVLSGTITATVNSADNIAVTRVEYYVDSTLNTTTTTPPFSAAINTTRLANGQHSLTARAYDAAGNTTVSSPVTVTVSNTSSDTVAPKIKIKTPTGNTTVSGNVSISTSATDNVGVVSMTIYVDGVMLATKQGSSLVATWPTAGVPAGKHTISVEASDAAGNIGKAAIPVYTK